MTKYSRIRIVEDICGRIEYNTLIVPTDQVQAHREGIREMNDLPRGSTQTITVEEI